MKFSQLKKGEIYTNKTGVSAFRFEGFYDEYLAEFTECEYNVDKAEWEVVDPDFVHLFDKFEVTDLI